VTFLPGTLETTQPRWSTGSTAGARGGHHEDPGLDRMLVLTWYYGNLEVAYIS